MPDISMDCFRPVTHRDTVGDPYLEAMIADPQKNPLALRVGDRVGFVRDGKWTECTIISFIDLGPALMLRYRDGAGLESHNCLFVDAVIKRREERR